MRPGARTSCVVFMHSWLSQKHYKLLLCIDRKLNQKRTVSQAPVTTLNAALQYLKKKSSTWMENTGETQNLIMKKHARLIRGPDIKFIV